MNKKKRFEQKVFILRCWQESSEDSWHFLLENPRERHAFVSLADLIAHLRRTFPNNFLHDDLSDKE